MSENGQMTATVLPRSGSAAPVDRLVAALLHVEQAQASSRLPARPFKASGRPVD